MRLVLKLAILPHLVTIRHQSDGPFYATVDT